MPIDSRDKRSSAGGMGPLALSFDLPHGSIGAGDREQTAAIYRGLQALGPGPAPALATCQVYATLRTPDQQPAMGVQITFTLATSGPIIASDNMIIVGEEMVTVDGTGLFSAHLTPSALIGNRTYNASCPPAHLDTNFLVPNTVSADLLAVLFGAVGSAGPTAASATATCLVFGTLRSMDQRTASRTEITFTLTASNPVLAGDNLIIVTNQVATVDDTGFFSTRLTPSSLLGNTSYAVSCPAARLDTTLLVPNVSSVDLLTLI